MDYLLDVVSENENSVSKRLLRVGKKKGQRLSADLRFLAVTDGWT